jgi:hypothetical protein
MTSPAERPFDPSEEWEDGPMTVRNRRALFFAFGLLAENLDAEIARYREDGKWPEDETVAVDCFPPLTRAQPWAWWNGVAAAAWRMCEAMRTGEKWNPRTVAEEVCLAVAVNDYVELVTEVVEGMEDWPDLPVHEDDGDYEEVVPALCGDTDVEGMWSMAMDGLGDPTNEINIAHDLGAREVSDWFDSQFWEDDMPSAYV